MKLFFATLFAKLAYIALRILGRNASHFPGAVALKLCPDFLGRVAKCPMTICVTGTNGKTTVTNMVADFLEQRGKKVGSNRLDSNITEGVACTYVLSVGLFGRPKVDAMVLEVDERASRLILPYIKPDYLVCTNLFRDSIMRNAHPDYIFEVLETYIPDGVFMVLNADDPLSSRLKSGNERMYFSVGRQPSDVEECINRVADNTICPECQTTMKYDYLHYHHLGHYRCPACGYTAPEAAYTALDADVAEGTLVVEHEGEKKTYPLINDALYNIYNEIALIALASKLGYDEDTIISTLKNIGITETRFRELRAGDIDVICCLSKGCNSVACSRNFDNVRMHPGKKAVYLALDDTSYMKNTVEYTGWIWDVDYEFLNDPDIKQIVVTCPRCRDHRLRLLMAGVDPEKIFLAEDELEAADLIDPEGIDKVYLLYDNTLYDRSVKIADRIVRNLTERGRK
ncbi:MAG: DUF1727 domain-containing protein [Eubacteriaceae bacterium]|nr:DUF1727 domain-containing protein [Eubacteriaceae bacterium]